MIESFDLLRGQLFQLISPNPWHNMLLDKVVVTVPCNIAPIGFPFRQILFTPFFYGNTLSHKAPPCNIDNITEREKYPAAHHRKIG